MTHLFKRIAAAALAASLCAALLTGCAFGKKTITVYADGDYLDPKVLEAFTEETGIKVKYVVGTRTPTAEEKAAYAEEQGLTSGNASYYTSANAILIDQARKDSGTDRYDGMSLREILLSTRAKKLDGEPATNGDAAAYTAANAETSGDAEAMTYPASAYDVILTDNSTIAELANCQLLMQLDEDTVPNAANIDEEWQLDDYSITCLWETMGLLWNTSLIDTHQTRWSSLQDLAYAGKLLMPNNEHDCIAIALNALGYDVNTDDPEEIQAAYDFLEKQRDLVFTYTGRDAYPLMENGFAALMPCYSGDALYMMQQNSDLVFAIPSGGSFRISFGYCIPADSQKAEQAASFIDYMCSETNLAKNAVYCKYSLTSEGAVEKLDSSWHTNPLAYPPESITADAALLSNPTPEIRAQNSVFWTDFTAAKEEESP